MKEKEFEIDDEYHRALADLAALRSKFGQEKEFPTTDIYNKQLAKLLEQFRLRDKINKQREFMTPEHRRETIQKSAELDKKIEDFEKIIAAHYEAHQLLRVFETHMEMIDARQMIRIRKMYIYLKYRAPKEKFEEFVEIVNTLSPEEREDFLDQVAILEATQLDEIPGAKTE